MAYTWGFTYSTKYAEELGFEWKQLFKNILEDFSFSSVRICAYWDRIEKTQGVYDFSEVDYLLKLAKKSKLITTLSFGRKVPRWPEYHDPNWVKSYKKKDLEEQCLRYLEKLLGKYEHSNLVDRLQVENEPFVSFGYTDQVLTKSFFQKELSLVKQLSNKPIIITESAEWGNWKKTSRYADVLGINIYPISYDGVRKKYNTKNKWQEYKKKKNQITKELIVVELQAEPWGPGLATQMSKHEWQKSMNSELLKKNIEMTQKLGLSEIWMWGVEWWYFVEKEDLTIKETAQRIVNET